MLRGVRVQLMVKRPTRVSGKWICPTLKAIITAQKELATLGDMHVCACVCAVSPLKGFFDLPSTVATSKLLLLLSAAHVCATNRNDTRGYTAENSQRHFRLPFQRTDICLCMHLSESWRVQNKKRAKCSTDDWISPRQKQHQIPKVPYKLDCVTCSRVFNPTNIFDTT